jgi:hypothetical protein
MPVKKMGSDTPASATPMEARSKTRSLAERGQHAGADAEEHPDDGRPGRQPRSVTRIRSIRSGKDRTPLMKE